MFVDLTSEPLKPQSRLDEEHTSPRVMGVSHMADKYFLSIRIFYQCPTQKKKSDKQIFLQWIWYFIETCLFRGNYL